MKESIYAGLVKYFGAFVIYSFLVCVLFFGGTYLITAIQTAQYGQPSGFDALSLIFSILIVLSVPSIIIPLVPTYFILRKIGYDTKASFIALLSYAIVFIIILFFLVNRSY